MRWSASRVTGESSAGAVQLLDGRWQRKAVGLIAGEGAGASQPLLEPLTYVERALAPTSDLLPSDAPSTSEAVTGADRSRRLDHRADGDRHAAAGRPPTRC